MALSKKMAEFCAERLAGKNFGRRVSCVPTIHDILMNESRRYKDMNGKACRKVPRRTRSNHGRPATTISFEVARVCGSRPKPYSELYTGGEEQATREFRGMTLGRLLDTSRVQLDREYKKVSGLLKKKRPKRRS